MIYNSGKLYVFQLGKGEDMPGTSLVVGRRDVKRLRITPIEDEISGHKDFIAQIMNAIRTILDKNSAIGDEDLGLLDSLTRFPKLQSIYVQVMLMPVVEVVRELSRTLTGSLIGYVAGVTDRTVRSWTSGRHALRRGSATKLRVLLTAVRILREVESPKVVSRWFANSNPDLEEKAPAEMLKKGEKLDWVIRSAAAYVQDGV
jgi:hypothetical protein